MAFTLQIKRKGILNNKKLNLNDLLSNCHLDYGRANEIYVFNEGETNEQTAILFNRNRIGRGIFFSYSEMKKGMVSISYNIPTTEAEITDFINLAKEISEQYGTVEMYCEEEEQNYSLEELIENKSRMVQFSLESLHNFCQNKEYESYIFTLAMWPWVLTKEQVKTFANCTDLKEFEQTMHDMQWMDVYYAKPRLYKRNEKIGAYYVLTEECESIFPVKADSFINLDQLEIEEGFIQFYIFSEDRMVEGLFDYDKFMACMLERGAKLFDAEHVMIPSLTKLEIEEIIAKIS